MFAVAVAVQAALMSFNDLGVSNAIVWWPGSVRQAAATATTLALATSVGLYAACFVAAPYVADILNVPQAAGVLRLLSVTVIIDGASSVPIGLIGRQFRQGRRALADWLGFLVSTGLTIWLAVEGYGAWSLAWGRVAGNLVTTSSLYLLSGPASGSASTGRSHGPWSATAFRWRDPVCWSSPCSTSTTSSSDGCSVPPRSASIIAFNLSSWPSNVISVTMRQVSIPVLAQLGTRPDQLRQTFLAGTTTSPS